MEQLRITTILSLLLLIGCSDDGLELNRNYPENLINTWVESYEEDYGIYRPSDFMNFPTSWFRRTYTFMEGNECEYLVLSPVDAHYMESGKWEYDQKQSTIRIYKSNDELIHELKVTSLTSNILVIEL
ncbi:MAG: hypothetical protein ACI923_002763 [Flavobacteriales bacterium]|jgi:hypothetical protein